jgi:hypothetical protein
MAEMTASRRRAYLIARNGFAFAGMVAACGAAFLLVDHVLAWLGIQGLHRLAVALAADAACGVLGYFAFAGDVRLRTWLVFGSVIAFGALMVLFHDPGRTFYPLLTALPLAAVAAVATRATGARFERSRGRHGSP